MHQRSAGYCSFVIAQACLRSLGEILNLANHRNWIGNLGDMSSKQFGKPTAAAGAREIQLGIRVEF
jgi:hypothetical protein